MKKLLAISLASVVVAVMPLSASAAENTGSLSIIAENIKQMNDKMNTINNEFNQLNGEVAELVNAVKAQDPNVTINNNPSITNNPSNTNYVAPTITVGGNTVTNTNNNNSSSDTMVTSNSTSSSSGGGGGFVPGPGPVVPVVPVPGGGGGGNGGGGVKSSSCDSIVVYNGCPVYACKKIEINGCKSNATFLVNGVSSGTQKSASDLAKKVGGSLVSCVETSAPGVVFSTAKVNFFVGGVEYGDNIAVYQWQNNKWVQLSVSEIRKDHVIVNMTKHGPLAFVKVPALATIG